jgi:hypothetical protein
VNDGFLYRYEQHGKSCFLCASRALKKDGDDILPLIFTDNYLSLVPRERGSIECSIKIKMPVM